MYRLCELELDAWKSNDKANALKFLKTQWTFLDEHMIEWIPYLCDDLYNPKFKEILPYKFPFGDNFKEVARKYKEGIVEIDFYRGIAPITKSLLEHDYNQIQEMIKAVERLDSNRISELSKRVEKLNTEGERFYLIPKSQ
jgi:hypothetical protein